MKDENEVVGIGSIKELAEEVKSPTSDKEPR